MQSKKPQFVYHTKDVAQMIGCPFLNTDVKLRRYLRNMGVIRDNLVDPLFVAQHYFTIVYRNVPNLNKTVPVILVSEPGVKFIKKLIDVTYYGK